MITKELVLKLTGAIKLADEESGLRGDLIYISKKLWDTITELVEEIEE